MKLITRLLVLGMIIISTGLNSFAGPVRRVVVSLTQADGSTIKAITCGDEFLLFYTDLEGNVLKKENGMYRKATEDEVLEQMELWAERKRERRLSRPARYSVKGPKKEFGVPTKTVGNIKLLVVLVDFKDVKMQPTSPRSEFNDMFNKEGYSNNGHYGSLRDYFFDQSYGQLTIDFDVVGPYTLSRDLAFYGQNSPGENGSDMHPKEMVREACTLADKDVDFSKYDNDGDGVVDQIYVVCAGYDEACNTDHPEFIWPHQWDVQLDEDGGKGFVLDGVELFKYACSTELGTLGDTRMSGIGATAHELGHCFGLPDFYDVKDNKPTTSSYWSVMDHGLEWCESRVPVGYTALERMFCGWLQPVELSTENVKVTDMKPITSGQYAYIIRNDAHKDEYFLLQNIQAESWFYPLEAHGLLITYVDYDKKVWMENNVNIDPNHMEYSVMTTDPKDNHPSVFPFPGTTVKKTEFANNTDPKMEFYHNTKNNTKFMNVAITNISESSDGLVSFVYNANPSTGIEHLDAMGSGKSEVGSVYNLVGQKVGADYKGVVIINGKKYLNR